jgi:hypothetical protein
METLAHFGMFMAGLGVFFASLGLFWWVSLYEKVKLPKNK